MLNFEIKLHIGANDITFGMHRNKVWEILGIPETSTEKSNFQFEDINIIESAKDCYWENELQISYNDNLFVNFLEFYGKDSKNTNVSLDGINIFKTPAVNVIKHVVEKYNTYFDNTDEEIPYSYTFKDLDLSFWRQEIPLLDENHFEISESDEGKYFWSFGFGDKNYYNN